MSDFDSPPFDLSALMRQAQALQEKFKSAQEELANKTVEASSGGGMVQVEADGSLRVRRVTIDPAALAANDRQMLEDLVAAAVNEALRRAQEMVSQEMSRLTPFGALNLPNIFGGRG
jgi:DNA-binding YbaB/EbfC family protein